MTPIDSNVLRPGRRLPSDLYSRQGVKLLAEGTVLTEDMCLTLWSARRDDLYFAASIMELYEREILTARAQAPEGSEAREDLVTVGGVLALETGDEVEQHHADAYALGAFRGAEPSEDAELRISRWKLAEQAVAARSPAWEHFRRRYPRDAAPLDPSELDQPGWPDPARLARYRTERVTAYRKLLARLVAGVATDAALAGELIDDLVEKAARWPQRYAQLALLAPVTMDYLPDHSYTTAVLSVAIAARMGLSATHARLAGLAGLFADVGMTLVPKAVRSSGRPLNEYETARVWRHPTYSVLMLDGIQGLPDEVRLAVYQHHERENGAGYPHGVRSARITDLARIVAVADAFAAATAPRPHRPRKLPYEALEELIVTGAQRLYDRSTVRALVESTGLFPIGSFVKLSSGMPAVVVGTHTGQIDRPIVSPLRRASRLGGTPETIDLADYQPWELSVIRAIDEPYVSEV